MEFSPKSATYEFPIEFLITSFAVCPDRHLHMEKDIEGWRAGHRDKAPAEPAD